MNNFYNFLLHQNLSENTISIYIISVKQYFNKFNKITKQNLLIYKSELVDQYRGKTINLKIQGINKYLEFINKNNLKLKCIKLQQKNFLENVITDADYEFFKNQLFKDGNYHWYFIVRFLAATGARVSELIQFKYEHLSRGYIDLYTKAGKIRRIFIPISLCRDAKIFYNSVDRTFGYLFLNKNGNRF